MTDQPENNLFDRDIHTIRDSETKEIIARGNVYATKIKSPVIGDVHMISFDRKVFFNVQSDRFIITSEGEGESEIPFTKWDDYSWSPWMGHDNIPKDIYREFGIDELDPPMVEIVKELNQWRGVSTIVSCCGHGRHSAWVMVQFADIYHMSKIIYSLHSSHFPEICGKFHIILSPDDHGPLPVEDGDADRCTVDFTGEPVICLNIATRVKGEEAYSLMDKWALVLKSMRDIMCRGAVNINEISGRKM
jgi:hypothetical protein